MNDSDAKKLAKRIVDDLFESAGLGTAERLVLTSADGSDLGGWGKSAMQTVIYKHLTGEKPKRGAQ